ncbi:MAG: sigma factor [Hespellia sp.]|nr:sigma factor [Hespellia sp.]
MGTPDFENIYTEYFSDVYKYVLSLCRNEATAEEITQETFFKAMRNIEKFNGNCKLYVWLCQIAKNTYFKSATKQKHILPEMDTDTPDSALDSVFVGQEYLWNTWQHKWLISKSRIGMYLSKAMLASLTAIAIFLSYEVIALLFSGQMKALFTIEYVAGLICGSFLYASLGAVICLVKLWQRRF